MNNVDRRRVVIFLALAFGIAWAIALVIYLTGGLIDSPLLFPDLGITLALVLLAVGVMWAPAVAHILTRVITREGWAGARLRPRLRRGWPYWLAAWFLPGIGTVLGLVVYFALFSQYFDASLATLQQMLPPEVPLSPWQVAALQTLQAMIIAPIINSIATFGEEFGWRAYLQPKLMPLGARKALLFVGVIWGLWHAPVIAMGHNYGFDYPGYPWTGILGMTWFTILFSYILGWMTLRGGSVWPAVIGHAAINGIAALGAIFVVGDPNPLIGPYPVGVIGSIAFFVMALIIFLSRRALRPEDADVALPAES